MAQATTQAVTYYHTDALGSPGAATDQSGNLVWRETYRPYGERLNNAPGAATNPLWYTGKRQDPETGLVYMGARYYNPILGRFLSIDPIEPDENNLHSLNRYAYANNNPYKFTDPDGENPFLVLLFFGLAANDAATGDGPIGGGLSKAGAKAAGKLATHGEDVTTSVKHAADRGAAKAGEITSSVNKSEGRAGKQARLREMMDDPKVGSADRGWLKNDARHVEYGNKPGLRIPRNGRGSPGRKAEDKGYELAHPHNAPASQGNSYAGSKLKNHADHKVETRLQRHRY